MTSTCQSSQNSNYNYIPIGTFRTFQLETENQTGNHSKLQKRLEHVRKSLNSELP